MVEAKSKKPSKKSPNAIDRTANMDSSFEAVMKELNDFGAITNANHVTKGIESLSMAYDYAIGGLGVPMGMFTMIAGPTDAGKTTLAMLTAIAAVQQGLRVGVINREGRFDTDYAERSGMGKANKDYLLALPRDAEAALEAIRSMAKHKFDLCIMESIAALAPATEIDSPLPDANIGVLSRMMSKFYRDAVMEVAESGMATLLTNQIRDKIGVMYGNPETEPGGRAKDFYAEVHIKLTQPERKYLDKENKFEQVGAIIKGYTKKSLGVNHREISVETRFVPKLHVNIPGEITDFGLRLKLFTLANGDIKTSKAGGWAYKGVNMGNSETAAMEYIAKNPDLMQELEEGIRTVIRSGQIIMPLEKEKKDAKSQD